MGSSIITAKEIHGVQECTGDWLVRETKRLLLRTRHTPERKRNEGNPAGAYLMKVSKGFGWSSNLKRLTDAVTEAGIFRFDGMQPFIETWLDPRLDDPVAVVAAAVNACKRFNCFRGIVGIRLDGWEDKLGSYAIDDLIRFAAGSRDNIIFVFGISPDNEEAVEQLKALLIPHFSLSCLETERFTAHTLAANISRQLDECGLSVDRSGREELLRMCGSAVEGSSFHGYRTALIIADDIIGAASERGVRKRIPAALLAEYARSDTFGIRCCGTDQIRPTGFQAN